jgi:hypothetical protein
MSSTPPRRPVSIGERVVVVALVAALVGYAVTALLAHRYLSGLLAPLVGALLAIRHPRARFTAYVFFSALAVRGLVSPGWPLVAFAAGGILLMQTPAAARAWPKLVAGRTVSSTGTGDCSRMSGP